MQKGFLIEIETKNIFNNKKYCELADKHKKMINTMFGPDISDDTLIKSDLCEEYSKPDIYIEIGNIRKYISIKSGTCNSVHSEELKTLILYLRSIGISKRTQKTLLLFHYGDGTLDGTGEKRYWCEDLMKIMKKDIEIMNKELNDKEVIKKMMYRFVFAGVHNPNLVVDYIYFVRDKSETLTSREDLLNLVLNREHDYITKPQIGPMTVQPYLRDVNRVSKHPYKREIVQIKWNGLKGDVKRANYFANCNRNNL